MENDHLPEIGQLLEIGRIIVQNITHITLYFQLLLHFGTIIGPEMRFFSEKTPKNFKTARLAPFSGASRPKILQPKPP